MSEPVTTAADPNATSNVQDPVQPIQTGDGLPPVNPVTQSPSEPTGQPGEPPVADLTQDPPAGQVEQQTEPVSHPEDLQAAQDRLKQQVAQKNRLLSTLGIDPASDLAEQLEAGVITPEMLQRHVANQMGISPAPPQATSVEQVQQAQDPVQQAKAELDAVQAKYNEEVSKGEVTIDTNNQLLQAIQRYSDVRLDKVTQQFTEAQQKQQVDESVNRVLSVAQQGEYYGQMEPALQNDVNMASIAVTGMIANQEAQQLGLNPQNLNGQQMEFFAGKAQQVLNRLADYFINVGVQKARTTPVQQPQNQVVPNQVPGQYPVSQVPVTTTLVSPVPVGPAGSPVPPVSSYANANVNNHADMARQYIATQQRI